jgi:hypothetical protein
MALIELKNPMDPLGLAPGFSMNGLGDDLRANLNPLSMLGDALMPGPYMVAPLVGGVAGAAAGALLERQIRRRSSGILGGVLGGVAGMLVAKSMDKGA